jgi:hypothetical protein
MAFNEIVVKNRDRGWRVGRSVLFPAALLGLLAATAAPASAAEDGTRPPRPAVDVALDADDDGTITAEEMQSAAAALLQLDADGDGTLSRVELQPQHPVGGASQEPATGTAPPASPPAGGNRLPRRPPPILAALDADADGALCAAEIAAAPAALLTLDRDGDGQLAPQEYRPPRPAEGGGAARVPSARVQEGGRQ